MTDVLLQDSGAISADSILKCPECGEKPEFSPTPTQPLPGGRFGLLRCSCSEFPVLDSIPIMRRGRIDVQDHVNGRTEVIGPDHHALIDLLRADRGLDALVELLAFPPSPPFGLEKHARLRAPFTQGPWARLTRSARRGEVATMLADVESLTAQDWMELCYSRSAGSIDSEIFPYFFIRFGQPRYLSSIDFLRHLPVGRGPVLDLACGLGHLMYHLSVRDEPVETVGVDRNFFQLWVARRYVAPDQSYVCADRIDALPFADDAFAASLCTDAFHLLDDKQGCMDELRRVAADDTVLLDRVGNRNLEPVDNPGELTPQGYADLVRGAPVRLSYEEELFAAYRAGHGVDLSEPRDPAELDDRKWLSLISSKDTSLFADEKPMVGLPHGAGALRVNPIYNVHSEGDRVHLVFSFPSTWYAFENALMGSYSSAGERLDRARFDDLAAGRPIPESQRLLSKFVILGMPPDYARPPQSAPVVGSVAEGLRRGALHRLRSLRS